MTATQRRGSARFVDGVLTITVHLQTKTLTATYAVEDCQPDPRIAFPGYALTKDDGTVYHVAVEKFGPTCTCASATYRGGNSRIPCKHVAAMMACNLIPDGSHQ